MKLRADGQTDLVQYTGCGNSADIAAIDDCCREEAERTGERFFTSDFSTTGTMPDFSKTTLGKGLGIFLHSYPLNPA